MTLLPPEDLDGEELAYRLFQVTRDRTPWRVEDVLSQGRLDGDQVAAERAWRVASRGYHVDRVKIKILKIKDPTHGVRNHLVLLTRPQTDEW